MASLYLTEQGVVLRKTGRRLVVTRKEEVLLEVPCHQIDSVMLFGGIDFTTPAARQLCEQGISLALLTRRGKLVCRLAPPAGKNVTLRLAQYERSHDDAFCLTLARTLVSAKLVNAAALVRQHADNYGAAEFRTDLDELDQSGERIATAADLGTILGVEGNAARVYFGALRKMLRVPMEFPGRERRPPPDPVNALLSLGYTMLFNEIASLVEAAGLDPYVGFYHQVDYGRRSLAADLVEEFRAPLADRLALRLLNNRVLGEADFESHAASGATLLSKEGLKTYVKEYERAVGKGEAMLDDGEPADLRETMRRQVARLVRAVLTGGDYEAYQPAQPRTLNPKP